MGTQLEYSGLDKAALLDCYRTMQLIRQCEEQLARSHQRGLVHGACHTYVGEEAIAAGVFAHLRVDDVVFSTHRGHGHALAKGLHPRELIAELYGRETGCSHGRGGSMHLFKPEIGLMGQAVSLDRVSCKRVAVDTPSKSKKTTMSRWRVLAMAASTTALSMKG